MAFSVAVTKSSRAVQDTELLAALTNGINVYADVKDVNFQLQLDKQRTVLIFGDIFYYIKNDDRIKLIDSSSKQYIKKIFRENKLKDIIPRLEGQYIGLYIDKSRNLVHLFSDHYARLDSFYSCIGSSFYLSTSLDFVFANTTPKYDQTMLAHLFSVYGWYTPKGLTIYKNVKQLKVGEIITLARAGMRSQTIKFKPLKIEDYEDKDLDRYYRILRESVIARSNRNGQTWVSSSSGWDSSLLLGMLVDELGHKSVGMITGRQKYSEGTEVINKFEIDKVNRIGKYYGIKPVIVDLDFKNKNAPDLWKKVLPYYRSKHMYTYNSYNATRLSDALHDAAGSDQVIFNGETADSFHNFGFSQFATFFHTDKSFTEYADKMNCYLYGPSFFKKVIDGSYKSDKVFQIFINMMDGVEFESEWDSREGKIESYLFPFFYGSPRIPFAKTFNNPMLTEEGQKAVYCFPYREYMPEVLSGLSEKNIYSWLIYLYHSFHSQGSTVNSQKHAMKFNSHRCCFPFNDYRIIEFLSKSPEDWGRGLSFNNTKYPLKWVARNKIKFPYEVLNEGPHAYLYDVIEGFSLGAEVTYRSGVTGFFKDTLKERPYRDILHDEYFDLSYLDKLTTDYLDRKEVAGKDFNNLVSLITLCITGWY